MELTSITIPEGVTIEFYAFASCGLISITIPEGVTKIESNTFYECKKLASVSLPSTLESIGESAFEGCSVLTSIAIPSGVKTIEERAFADCKELTSVCVSDISSVDIHETAFANSNKVTFCYCYFCCSVYPGDGDDVYVDKFGVVYSKDKTTLLNACALMDRPGEIYTILNSVTSIGPQAFYNCSDLGGVVIPGGVTSVGDEAFYNCSGLFHIEVYSTTPPVCGENVFEGVNKWDILHVPGGTASDYSQAAGWSEFQPVKDVLIPYGIDLNPAGTDKNLGVKPYGYESPEPYNVTIYNTGQDTEELTIALSGDDADSFTLSTETINNIAMYYSDEFTVVPVTGLAVGAYSATVTVSGGNGISASFNVTFEVIAAVYGIALNPDTDKDFGSAIEGYDALTAYSVTVSNTGNMPTGALTVALSGDDADSFTLSAASVGSIAVEGNDNFTVVPNTGLAIGTYAATVTVSGDNDMEETFDVTFEVIAAPAHSIALNPAFDKDFGQAIAGYEALTAHKVTVSNTGNQSTGELTIELSGDDADSFMLSKTSITDMDEGEDDEFTVVPVTGLAIGTYFATVTVSGSNEISASFNVSFEVIPVPVYSIALNPDTDKDFGFAEDGYEALTAHKVTVSNTGNQSTGELTIGLSGDDADSFMLSKTSITDMDEGEDDEFTVVPVTGLEAGGYSATVTVSGDNGISKSFNVTVEIIKTSINDVLSQPAALKAWEQDGWLYVSGLTAGKPWSVHSVSGAVIYQGIAGGDKAKVNLSIIRGVYIIVSGNREVKIIY